MYENDDGYLLIDEAALKQIMELKRFDKGSICKLIYSPKAPH